MRAVLAIALFCVVLFGMARLANHADDRCVAGSAFYCGMAVALGTRDVRVLSQIQAAKKDR